MLLTRNRFITEQDTPSSYSGQTGLFTRVNAAEDALEFAASTAAIPTKADLFDLGLAHWTIPGWGMGVTVNSAIFVERLYYIPIYLERSTTFTGIGLDVITLAAGAVVRLGIYAAIFDGDGQLIPDMLTLDAGTVSVATTGEKTIVIAETLAAGWHFLAISSDGAPVMIAPSDSGEMGAPTTAYRTTINQFGNQLFSVTVADGAAALPDPATTPTTRERGTRAYVALRL